MSRKDKNSQNHPLYARVMAMILALSMLLGSSGFQVLAEEIGNQSILSGEERSAAADQDMDEEQRAVLRLKFWSQKPRPTDAAIAQRLNISTSTLYRRIGQIYRHVAQKLGMDL